MGSKYATVLNIRPTVLNIRQYIDLVFCVCFASMMLIG